MVRRRYPEKSTPIAAIGTSRAVGRVTKLRERHENQVWLWYLDNGKKLDTSSYQTPRKLHEASEARRKVRTRNGGNAQT